MCTKRDYEAIAAILKYYRDEAMAENDSESQKVIEMVAASLASHFFNYNQNFSLNKFVEAIGVDNE